MKEMGLDPGEFMGSSEDPELADLEKQLRKQEAGGDDEDDEDALLRELGLMDDKPAKAKP